MSRSSSVALRLWCLSSTKKYPKDLLFRKTLSFLFLFFSFLFLLRGRILDPIGKYKMAFLIDQSWLALKSWLFGGDPEIESFPRCLVDGLNQKFFSRLWLRLGQMMCALFSVDINFTTSLLSERGVSQN